MNAYEVAKPLDGSVVDGFKFCFGIDDAKVVAQLRKFADAIEGKEMVVLADGKTRAVQIIVERVTHETSADREDFTTSKITFIVAERIKP
jgi:acyl-CoA hydrolase